MWCAAPICWSKYTTLGVMCTYRSCTASMYLDVSMALFSHEVQTLKSEEQLNLLKYSPNLLANSSPRGVRSESPPRRPSTLLYDSPELEKMNNSQIYKKYSILYKQEVYSILKKIVELYTIHVMEK